MTHPVLLKILRKKKETEDAFSFYLEVPLHQSSFFAFAAGQYLSLLVDIEGYGKLKRAYSICTPPGDIDFGFTVKRVPNGIVSNYLLDEIEEGDSLSVYPPEGKFNISNARNIDSPVLFIAAGSGITPIFSMIRHLQITQPQRMIYLLYGNRSERDIIYKQELDMMIESKLKCHHVFSKPNDKTLASARISDEMVARLFEEEGLNKQTTDVFVCGPEGMIDSIHVFFEKYNIDKRNFHYELFWQQQPQKAIMVERVKQECIVTVKLDGHLHQIQMISDEIILKKLLENDIDAPYTCQNGTCSTCKAKVMSGRMGMITCRTLDVDEIAEGFVLACQAYPETELVTLDFDY